ncbi:extracellular solute-binding protein [Streptomyces sp. NPDC006739]|uniref:extracellular solute-binding protein n=1 Tax=Streptomyces sp. NPDC006739 TaxID=3364763 RepID=UPI0036868C5A
MSAPGSGPATAAPDARRRLPRPAARTLTVLAGCLVLLAAALVHGVRVLGQEPTVTLLANWTGGDERNFRDAVIAPFEAEYHVHVDYQGSSAESQVLSADVEAGTPPDVAVLTGPGELASYVHDQQLQPVENLIPEGDFSRSWATPFDGHVYWFPLKADLKSVVWFPGDTSAEQLAKAKNQPAQWCLGMGSGATSGWPGTDWIEDLVLQQSGWQKYQQWARGELSWQSKEVRRAWTTWRDLVLGPAGNEELARRALMTEYQKASEYVTARPRRCTLEHQASFIRTQQPAWGRVNGRYVPSAELFPQVTATDSWEVSGDLVALLHATPEARKLIRYLASVPAQQAWSGTESGFSVDAEVTPPSASDTTSWHRSLAATLLDDRAVHCFDASDAMPPAVRDAFAQATIDFLARPQSRNLDRLLKNLDTLGKAPGLNWLPSVCDHVT